jgi:hypothetical protein
METKHTLLAESPADRLQRVLKIFRGIKPLLRLLTSLPLLPASWRSALLTFVQALDALAAVGPEITARFKAGRDL